MNGALRGSLLADPARYVPGTMDLAGDTALRRYWIDLFRRHARDMAEHVAREGDPARHAAVERARARFGALLDALDRGEGPEHFDTLTLCRWRETALRREGIPDPYAATKAKENELALRLLPEHLAEIDRTDPEARLDALVEGIFAGNLFDLGSPASAALFAQGEAGFYDARDRLPARPWRVDHLERVRARWGRRPPWRDALLFVDNAGGDVVLGMLPLARELVRRGTRVVLSANDRPALNDVTHDELGAVVARAAALDPVLAAARTESALALVPSGGWLPLLDLRELGPALRAEIAARPPDLVVLEGMGRGVESNWHARLCCDAWKLAMLKDESVAHFLGGRPWDVVCRFDPAAPDPDEA